MFKKIFLCMIFSIFAFAETIAQDQLKDQMNFLEMYKQYKNIHNVHSMRSQAQRSIDRIDNVNFAMKPYKAPFKSFDSLLVHHVYPLKIFLPSGCTVTSANLSNSANSESPTYSQNTITVHVSPEFQSGILDIVYFKGENTKKSNFLSIKLDIYIPKENELDKTLLYTQAIYYEPVLLKNEEVLAKLTNDEREKDYSQIEYMGIVYDIYLVSVIKNKQVIKSYKDEQYINAAVIFNNATYNYQVITGAVQ